MCLMVLFNLRVNLTACYRAGCFLQDRISYIFLEYEWQF